MEIKEWVLCSWCGFVGLCGEGLMRDNSFRLFGSPSRAVETALGQETARSMRRFQARKWSKPHRGFAKKAFARPHGGRQGKEECRSIISGTTSPLRGSCHCFAMGRTEASYPTKAPRKMRCKNALSGATSSLRSSCRRKRRGEPTSENSGSFFLCPIVRMWFFP